MPRPALVPAELSHGVFSLAEARRAGISRSQLRSSSWRRIGPGAYAWIGVPDSPLLAIEAIRQRLPTGAAFAGHTSTWLHGVDVRPCDPIEVIVPPNSGLALRGVWISRARLTSREVCQRRGMPVTTMERTLSDLSRRLPMVEAVVIADMALHQGLVDLGQLDRRLAPFVEPATESQMESRLRMVLVEAGLPRPQAQVPLYDSQGRFLGRADLYYPAHRLVLEYDGGTHRDRMVEDNRRQNGLISAAFHVLRFTAPDVLGAPESVARQVREVLAQRPKRTFS